MPHKPCGSRVLSTSGEFVEALNFRKDNEQREIRDTNVDTASIVERIAQMIYGDIFTTKKFRYGKYELSAMTELQNAIEELYKYLLIVQCNALNKILPGMFQKIADYTGLLLPDNLLRDGSVIHQMIEPIPEDDWKDAVQIIGWLYQYYNSGKKPGSYRSRSHI